jgi:uncharacterized membrane protein
MDKIAEVIAAYLQFLLDQLKYDVDKMSQPWMYWLLLVPIIFYGVFFIMKWMVLLVPVTLPIILWSSLKSERKTESKEVPKKPDDDKVYRAWVKGN